MRDTHRSRLEDKEDALGHEVLRTPRLHRNQGALQRALRQERVARRRNFLGWLLTVLLAIGAGGALVFWIAELAVSDHSRPSPSAAPALPAATSDEPLPAGVVQRGLPAR